MRRGRITTVEKLGMATQEESVCPADYTLKECTFQFARVAWRIINGQAVRIAYRIYAGLDGRVPQGSGVPKRGELARRSSPLWPIIKPSPDRRSTRSLSDLRSSAIWRWECHRRTAC